MHCCQSIVSRVSCALIFTLVICGAVPEKKRQENLAKIGEAMNTYHNEHQGYPRADGPRTPQESAQVKDFKTGLSWRVHILPQLGHKKLYDKFKLDEPWDSDANKPLVAEMPDVYRSAYASKPGETCFHVLLGPKKEDEAFIFTNPKAKPVYDESTGIYVKDGVISTEFRNVLDGLSNTILAVEAGPTTAEPWTKPGGLIVDTAKPKAVLGIKARNVLLLMADGKVRNAQMSKLTDAKFLALLTRYNFRNEENVLKD